MIANPDKFKSTAVQKKRVFNQPTNFMIENGEQITSLLSIKLLRINVNN